MLRTTIGQHNGHFIANRQMSRPKVFQKWIYIEKEQISQYKLNNDLRMWRQESSVATNVEILDWTTLRQSNSSQRLVIGDQKTKRNIT